MLPKYPRKKREFENPDTNLDDFLTCKWTRILYYRPFITVDLFYPIIGTRSWQHELDSAFSDCLFPFELELSRLVA